MDKYQNKYRIPSSRLHGYDYGQEGAYFITICTKDRLHYFGEIVDGEMQLNEIGKTAEQEWIKTPGIRPDMNLELGEFVVMPNHFHAIIIIGHNKYNASHGNGRDAMHRVSADGKNKFGPQSKNLASIVRGFKSAVTTFARKIPTDFAWQPRYHDHIIRNSGSFQRIQNYIHSH